MKAAKNQQLPVICPSCQTSVPWLSFFYDCKKLQGVWIKYPVRFCIWVKYPFKFDCTKCGTPLKAKYRKSHAIFPLFFISGGAIFLLLIRHRLSKEMFTVGSLLYIFLAMIGAYFFTLKIPMNTAIDTETKKGK